MSRSLLVQRRFAPLFVSQFFSAFNDNFLKNSLVFLILYKMSGADAEALVSLAGAVIVVPFFFLSGIGGQLADRYDKAKIAARLRLAEVAVAGIAVAGFAAHSVPILFVALAGFGIISALFGPVKYGILPDHLREDELPRGNALVEGATFIAILAGTFIGALVAADGGDASVFGVGLIAVSLAAWGAAALIPPTGERAPDLRIDRNILRSTAELVRDLRQDRRIWVMAIVVSLFWLIGAVMLSLLPVLVKVLLGGNELVVSAYLAVFAVAVALGSGLGAFLATGRIVLTPVPAAAIVMALGAADLAIALIGATPATAVVGPAEFFTRPLAWRVAIDLGILAAAGGVYVVPSFAAVQHWAPIARRARVVAGVNVITALFMTLGGIAVGVLQKFGVPMSALVGGIALVALATAVWTFRVLPVDKLHDVATMLAGVLFRLEVEGREHVEAAGPNAVVVANHVSFLDAILVFVVLGGRPVFAIDTEIAKLWWVKPVLRVMRAVTVDPTKPLATRTLVEAARQGGRIIIFPEGRITVTGGLMKVYDGAGMVADKAGLVVLPLHIAGAEASMASRLKPDQIRKRWFPKIRVTVGAPRRLDLPEGLKARARRRAAGVALADILSDLTFRAASTDRTLPQAVIDAAKRWGMGRQALRDPLTGTLTYGRFLTATRALGAALSAGTADGEAVGVLLPTANACAVTLVGLMSAGRVPAMLNFTAGAANVRAACATAAVKRVVTARAFVDKGRLQPLIAALEEVVEIVYLEDVRPRLTLGDKLRARLLRAKPIAARRADDPAVILFTSGSEGAPKGVALSHRNLLSNVTQVAARIDFGGRDRILNALPLFHALGLVGGVVLPLGSGVPVFLYPSPLHYRVIPEITYGCDITALFGTDTFLAGYARAANPYDFRSVRLVVAGAEPVRETTRRLYADTFGVRIYEGYGVTETSPVLALNTPMAPRAGTVGRLLPAIEHRLERIEGIDEGRRLWVKGPNVMLGYIRPEAPGVIVPPEEGWHDTGDVVAIDGDGYVAIKGRAKRFAKIGGEMVSLAAIEALAAACWPGAVSVALAEADERKGERTVLVTAEAGASRTQLALFMKARGASDLMLPAEVMVVPAIPLLGSGKADVVATAALLRERRASEVA
jgi:acyl-[acyl-carrier-protein]-phospholipid O-acyltransferase/long-chain-fatty-acid--[acyl-carrier-protein] ligase